jgi:hypothetical protein
VHDGSTCAEKVRSPPVAQIAAVFDAVLHAVNTHSPVHRGFVFFILTPINEYFPFAKRLLPNLQVFRLVSAHGTNGLGERIHDRIAREVLSQIRLELGPVRPYFCGLDGCGSLRLKVGA